VEQLPPFADYDMKGRTYRYFEGDPLYPFGYGLSYTRFEYSDLKLDKPSLGARDPLEVSLAVKNAGSRPGAEVVQLYTRALGSDVPMPIKSLRGFERVSLAPGETRRVSFHLTPITDMSHYDAASKAFTVSPGEYEVQAGASSRDVRLAGRLRVQ
jgi:beta-glucosidase